MIDLLPGATRPPYAKNAADRRAQEKSKRASSTYPVSILPTSDVAKI